MTLTVHSPSPPPHTLPLLPRRTISLAKNERIIQFECALVFYIRIVVDLLLVCFLGLLHSSLLPSLSCSGAFVLPLLPDRRGGPRSRAGPPPPHVFRSPVHPSSACGAAGRGVGDERFLFPVCTGLQCVSSNVCTSPNRGDMIASSSTAVQKTSGGRFLE